MYDCIFRIHSRDLGCTICENIIQDVDNFLTSHTTEEEITSFVHGVSNVTFTVRAIMTLHLQLCSRQHGMVETMCNSFIADNLPHLINHFVISQLVDGFLEPASICQTLRACPRPDSGPVPASSTTNQLSESAVVPGTFCIKFIHKTN